MRFNDGENENGEDTTSAKLFAARMPYPLAIGGAVQLQGRTRRCGFWVSAMVPDNTRYIVDSNQLAGIWQHNAARDQVPSDCLLVVISPADEDHIRKAMATRDVPVGAAVIAAQIIDEECRKDALLAGRMRWKVTA